VTPAASSTSVIWLAPAAVRQPSVWRRSLPRGVIIMALVVVGLNLLDAFCTLRHLENGAVELNPLMRLLLEQGPLTFLVGKHCLAGAGILGIAAQSSHPAAQRMLRFVLLPVYSAIGTYQLALFAVV
jgi:hypothetical protein